MYKIDCPFYQSEKLLIDNMMIKLKNGRILYLSIEEILSFLINCRIFKFNLIIY